MTTLDPVRELGTHLYTSGRLDPQVELDLARLVRSAAHSAECSIAVLYIQGENGLTPFLSFGTENAATADPANWVVAEVSAMPLESVFVANDVPSQPGCDKAHAFLFGKAAGSVRFVAAVRVAGDASRRPGILFVADRSPRAGLSAAATYVLHTHAKQLIVAWEAETYRQVSDMALRTTIPDTVTERLRLLESVVVHANDAVLITKAEPIDLPGPEIVYCNAAFTRTTGYAEAEVLGHSPRMLQAPGTDRKALDRLRLALSRWEPIEVELLNRKKDGTDFWVELSIVPVANERGWYTHWVSVQRDVTERKAAEETAMRARVIEAANLGLEAEIRERKSVESRLLYTAFHDDLTKLRNRAFFMDRLTVALNRCRAEPDANCAVLFMDLDGFKLVNDSLGHRAGDLMLMEVSQRLRACMRPNDTLARLGGDEFAIIIESWGEPAPAIPIAERIIESLHRPIWLGKQEVFCSCSIGIAVGSPLYILPEDLLRDADIAMYTAKRNERGTYATFGGAMHDSAVQALEMQTDLRNAISRGEFFLQYQPICDAATRRITGLEALIRWSHPQRGVVQPGSFIGVAEETGLVRDIGRWVLNQACVQMGSWRTLYPSLDLRLSINVSGKELRHEAFAAETRAALALSGFDPARLEMEITESVFLHQPELVGTVLESLRTLGIRIALDDFGTGYSSLSFIDRYAMDTIKIDRSFVGRMLVQHRTMAIVRSIVQLGAGLGLDIVAEGVENEEQLQTLLANGCTSVQGYLLSRPLSVENMEALLAVQASD